MDALALRLRYLISIMHKKLAFYGMCGKFYERNMYQKSLCKCLSLYLLHILKTQLSYLFNWLKSLA